MIAVVEQWDQDRPLLIQIGNEARPDPMNISIAHDPARNGLKVVLVGSPADTASMLRLIQGLMEA